jgi:outer membrane protein OmpA-like peptidoglycan-associated protein
MILSGPSFFRPAALAALLLFFCGQKISGQNLVPNPSFEDVNMCAEYDQPCSPSAWFYLSRKLTTGYFPRYSSATGARHLQIAAVSRETVNRQYWETMLLCPLVAGARYTVSLKIASPETQTTLSKHCPNLRDIGLWFTNRWVFVQGDSLLQPHSYLSFTGATTTDLKNGWFEIKKEFVPLANSSILILGNFYRMANADIMDQRGSTIPTIDILVDDISVVPIKASSCGTEKKIKDSLYAVTWRHSEHWPPQAGDTLSQPDGSTPRSADSVRRPGDSPVGDPLWGPEPRRVINTPKPVTDTIIIHNIQFDFDQYLIQNPDTLKQYRRLLTMPGIKKIQVMGFTDDVGSDAYNLDLSQKRAQEVARLLSSTFNIDPALIEAKGKGISKEYPTRELNRRVEIYIFHE